MTRMLNLFRRILGGRDIPIRARIGQKGERAAARYLRRKGYRLLIRNWRRGQLEIDLVMRDGAALVFVEVRTRDEGSLTPGIHSLGSSKRAAQKRAIQAYLRELRKQPTTWRMDLIDVRHASGHIIEILHHQSIQS